MTKKCLFIVQASVRWSAIAVNRRWHSIQPAPETQKCAVLEHDTGTNTGCLPICQNQIQRLFKDFQGPYKGYISEGVRIEAPQVPRGVAFLGSVLLPSQLGSLWEQRILGIFQGLRSLLLEAMHYRVYSVLENLIQALSRTFRHRFKDFQGPCLFSRTWRSGKIIQGLSKTRKSPANTLICSDGKVFNICLQCFELLAGRQEGHLQCMQHQLFLYIISGCLLNSKPMIHGIHVILLQILCYNKSMISI